MWTIEYRLSMWVLRWMLKWSLLVCFFTKQFLYELKGLIFFQAFFPPFWCILFDFIHCFCLHLNLEVVIIKFVFLGTSLDCVSCAVRGFFWFCLIPQIVRIYISDLAQKYPVQYGNTQGGLAPSYGYHGTSKMIEVPNGRVLILFWLLVLAIETKTRSRYWSICCQVGVIIGRSGETIKYLQHQSGAKIQVTRDIDADPNAPTRAVELTGTPDQISRAEELINDVLAEVVHFSSLTCTYFLGECSEELTFYLLLWIKITVIN